MEVNKILVLINLDIDKKGELRQLVLTDKENELLKTLLIKGAFCDEIKLLDEPVGSIVLK